MKKMGCWFSAFALLMAGFSGCGQGGPAAPAPEAPVGSTGTLSAPRQSDIPTLTAVSTASQSKEYSSVPPVETIASFYTRNPAGYTYVGSGLDFGNPDYILEPQTPRGVFDQKILDGLALFEGLTPADEKHTISDNAFLLWTTDGVRHTYGTARGGFFIADGKTYLLPADKQAKIEELHQFLLAQDAKYSFTEAYPQWLQWMTPSKIEKIIFHSPTRGPRTIRPALVEAAAEAATLPVKRTGEKTYKPGSVDFSGDDVFHLEIQFQGGVVYHIYAVSKGTNGDYYVESSDMSYGCKYRLKMTAADGPAEYLINQFEFIADAKTVEETYNPAT